MGVNEEHALNIHPEEELPPDSEVETALISCIFANVHYAEDAFRRLRSEAFLDSAARILFTAAKQIHADGGALDRATIRAKISTMDVDRVISPGYLADVFGATVYALDYDSYLRWIWGAWQRREAEAALKSALALVQDPTQPPEAWIEGVQNMLDRVIESAAGDRLPSDAILEEWEAVQQRRENPARFPSFGLTGLDSKIWIRPGQLGTVAALTSTGKSTLLGQMALHNCRLGHEVLFISCEMADSELYARMFRYETDRSDPLSIGRLTREEVQAVARDADDRPLRVHEATGLGEIVAQVRKSHAKARGTGGKGLGLVCVDYYGIIDAEGVRAENAAARVSAVTKCLKRLARDLRIPIVGASQFNRTANQSGKPELHQLKDSGSIEQDSDWVIIAYRQEQSERGLTDHERVLADVAKNRNGEREPGIPLWWDGKRRKLMDGEGQNVH